MGTSGTAAEGNYSKADHPKLSRPQIKEIFDSFRREVLDFDDDVTETYTKHYVAYKLNTNFVDAYPRTTGLKLTLNMKFTDINDPRGLCENVEEKRVNGDVEVRLNSLSDLRYIVSLVRQAFLEQYDG